MEGLEKLPAAMNPRRAPEVRAQLRRMLESRVFRSSERLSRFLEYIVECTLAGRAEQIKEYTIGVEVCDRGREFDPRVDPIVRIDARRLRERLRDYYDAEGRGDSLRIEVEPGAYVPRFGGIAAAAPARGRAEAPSSLAVLPLETPGDDEPALAEGLADGLISALARLPGLAVAARTSTFVFRGTPRDAREIGEALGVSAILEGSLQRYGSGWRTRLRLIDAVTGLLTWSEEFDSADGPSLELQDDICGRVCKQLGKVRLPERGARRAPISAEAYAQYYRGRHRLAKINPGAMAGAVEAFEAAIDESPRFAAAYAGLASARNLLGLYGERPPRESYLQARFAAEKAIALDASTAEAWAALAQVRVLLDWDWEGADRDYARALELDPSAADALGVWAAMLMWQRRADEAQATINRAMQLDPLSLAVRSNRALVASWAGRREESERLHREILELDPRFYRAHWALAIAFTAQGRYIETLERYRAAREGIGDAPFLLGWQGHGLAMAGRREEARANLRLLESMSAERFVPAMSRGLVLLGLGERDPALECFAAAVDERTAWALQLGVNANFVCLRGDPRYHALLRKMRLG
jgi:serine/threonine-protein kinase